MTQETPLERLFEAELTACCGSPYDSEALRWLLGDELHPGGDALSRRLAQLAGLGPGRRVLDVASGRGRTARLLASEFGAEVTGIELSAQSVGAAQRAAEAGGLGRRVRFIEGPAVALPVAGGSFDAVLCECALCLFPGKERALAEMHRVLGPGGVVAIADVTAELDDLSPALRSAAAHAACIAGALPSDGYEALLHDARFELVKTESHGAALAALAERVEYRLRVARMIDTARADAIAEATELVREARRAITRGSLGYRLFVARRRDGRAPAVSPAPAAAGAGRAD